MLKTVIGVAVSSALFLGAYVYGVMACVEHSMQQRLQESYEYELASIQAAYDEGHISCDEYVAEVLSTRREGQDGIVTYYSERDNKLWIMTVETEENVAGTIQAEYHYREKVKQYQHDARIAKLKKRYNVKQ